MLQLSAITKRLGAGFVLQVPDLRVTAGSTVALVGPSGSGKTTLLWLLNGLAVAEAGEVWVDGTKVGPETVEGLRRRIGYAVQDGGLFPHLDAGENVTLMAGFLRWPKAKIDARLDELVALTRFPPGGLRRFPLELSGGQRQRVALMRALMLDPGVLLLDEPLGALDPMVRTELQEDLARVFATLGKTVVLVTHDLAEAAFLSGRIVLLRDGVVVQDGTLDDLLRRPATPFVSAFVRSQRTLVATEERP